MGPTCTFLLEQLPLTMSSGPKSRSLVTECCSGNDRQAGEARRQAKQKPRKLRLGVRGRAASSLGMKRGWPDLVWPTVRFQASAFLSANEEPEPANL